jgi:hypothetical protein
VSGTYYARVKVNGKQKWRMLGTTLFSVAKLRLGDVEKSSACRVCGERRASGSRRSLREPPRPPAGMPIRPWAPTSSQCPAPDRIGIDREESGAEHASIPVLDATESIGIFGSVSVRVRSRDG